MAVIVEVPFRLAAWILLVLSSGIAVLSVIDEHDNDKDAWPFEIFWAVVLLAITGGLAAIMAAIHGVAALRHQHLGMDHGAIVTAVVAWVMAIPVIMDPDKQLAINQNTTIIDANLYFSSWWGFMASLALFVFHGSEALTQHLSREWICLFIASLVTTMAASHRIDDSCSGTNQSNNSDDDECAQLRLAITLATFSAACAAAVAISFFFARVLKQWILLIVSIVELGLWAVLVGLLTFKDGPAKQVGTLFFGIWICTLVSLYVSLQQLYGIFHPERTSDNENDGNNTSQSDKWHKASQHDNNEVDPRFPDLELGQEEEHDKGKNWWEANSERESNHHERNGEESARDISKNVKPATNQSGKTEYNRTSDTNQEETQKASVDKKYKSSKQKEQNNDESKDSAASKTTEHAETDQPSDEFTKENSSVDTEIDQKSTEVKQNAPGDEENLTPSDQKSTDVKPEMPADEEESTQSVAEPEQSKDEMEPAEKSIQDNTKDVESGSAKK